jgi:hypothetical protein
MLAFSSTSLARYLSSHVVSPLLYRLSYLATLNKNPTLYLSEQNAKVLFTAQF